MSAISLVLGFATALLCMSGASCVSVTIPPAFAAPVASFAWSPIAPGPEVATVMERIEETPMEGSARTNTILSLRMLDLFPAGGVDWANDAGRRTTETRRAEQ